jgi:DNA repair exonuclease SbcCD ATPase subunit
MGLNKIVGIIIAVVVIGAAAYFLLPGFKSKVDSTYDKHFGWTPEARKKDPVGFIDHSIQKLGENIAKFEEARTGLRVQQGKLEDLKKSNSEKIAFAEKLLAQLKNAYKDATGGKGWPITVGGKSYSEDDLKTQVSMSLAEKTGYEKIVAQTETGMTVAEKRMRELVTRISESKSKRSLLEAQRALVEVNKLSADTEKLLADVNDVLVENEAALESSGPQTIEELMKAEGSAAVVNPDTEKFLNE